MYLLRILVFFGLGLSFFGCQNDKTSLLDNGTKEWSLTYLAGIESNNIANRPTMHLDGKKVFGYGGCNRYFGEVEIDNSSVSFLQIASTKMACLDNDIEQHYFAMLEKVASYSIEESKLIFLDNDGGRLAIFE